MNTRAHPPMRRPPQMKSMISSVLGLFDFPTDLPQVLKQVILEFAGLVRFGKKATFYVIYV